MKFVMEYNEWQIHQSDKDGHLEAWKTWGEKIVKKGENTEKTGKDVKRIVLLAKDLNGALTELKMRTSKRREAKDKEDPNQLRIE